MKIIEGNKMQELRELHNFGGFNCNNLITEKSKLPKFAIAKLRYSFAKSGVKNLNNRIYPEEILMREVNKKNTELATQNIPGMLNHPHDGSTKLDKVSHVISSISYDKNTKVASAESYVLNTTAGRDFMVLLDSKILLGASMRGWGTLNADREVQSDYKLNTIDFVDRPSFGTNATINQSSIIESADMADFKDTKHEEKTMNKKVQPKDCFYEAKICGISSELMAEKINKNNEKVEISEHRKKLFQETMLSCPEKSREEIDEIVNRTLVFESKIKPTEKEEFLSEGKIEKSERRTRGNAQLVREAGGTAADVRRLNAYDEEKDEKERKRRNLIAIIGRTGQIAGLGSEEVEKLVTAELKLAGLE